MKTKEQLMKIAKELNIDISDCITEGGTELTKDAIDRVAVRIADKFKDLLEWYDFLYQKFPKFHDVGIVEIFIEYRNKEDNFNMGYDVEKNYQEYLDLKKRDEEKKEKIKNILNELKKENENLYEKITQNYWNHKIYKNAIYINNEKIILNNKEIEILKKIK
jgi:predicted nuclease with TOPRIM domain